MKEEYMEKAPFPGPVTNRYKKKEAYASPHPPCLASLPSCASNAHLCGATAHTGYFCKGSVGQIEDAAAIVRAPVVDSYSHSPAVSWIDHSNFGTEGEIAMGSSEAISIETLSIGGALSIEAISMAIP